MKCPACNVNGLNPSAWLPCEGGHYKDDNYYDCASCGPVSKDYVDAATKRITELEEELASLRAENERLKELVKSAFMDGLQNGRCSFNDVDDSVYWTGSDTLRALQPAEQEGED